MRQNMDISRGLPMAESLMTTLISKGVGRGNAHELMRKASIKATELNKTLKEVVLDDKEIMQLIDPADVDFALNPDNYLGSSEKIVEKVIKKLKR